MAPPILKLTAGGSADKVASPMRNGDHVTYITTHGALAPELTPNENAAHILYQATHDAQRGADGARLIGNAAEGGEEAAIAEARGHQGHQWRWVVSLRGDDADRLGYDTPAAWHRLAHELAPRLGAAIGIQADSLRWVAAHHDPVPHPGGDRHPHLHIAIWSARELNRSHRLNRDELRAARRAVVQAINGPERARLGQERTALRDLITRTGAETLKEALAAARQDRARLTLPDDDRKALGEHLRALAQQMPGRGRAALAFMPPHVKDQARAVADWLLDRRIVAYHVDQFRETVRAQAALYTSDETKLAEATARAYNDLRDRVANAVVRSAAQLPRGPAAPGVPGGESLVQRSVSDVVRLLARLFREEPVYIPPLGRRRRTRTQSSDRGRE